MTENEKAKELIATSETTVKVDPQNGWYLKRFAALQFEGSVDNFSTNMPIHVLEQQLPKDDTMKLDDAVIEGQDFDYSKFYDERGNEYSSVSELVQTLLDLDDDDSIQEYNEENPDLPYIPYEKLREMDKKDIPELLLSVADEADYVDAYKEVTDIESWNVEVTPMSNNYETMGYHSDGLYGSIHAVVRHRYSLQYPLSGSKRTVLQRLPLVVLPERFRAG